MSESQPLPVQTPWWQRPIGMGLVGLALMVGGWKLSTWVPETAHDQEQAEKVAEIRRMSDDEKLKSRLDEIGRRQPPNEMAGRLAVLAGLVLFVVAGVRMYQTPAVKMPSESNRERESDYSQPIQGEETTQR